MTNINIIDIVKVGYSLQHRPNDVRCLIYIGKKRTKRLARTCFWCPKNRSRKTGERLEISRLHNDARLVSAPAVPHRNSDTRVASTAIGASYSRPAEAAPQAADQPRLTNVYLYESAIDCAFNIVLNHRMVQAIFIIGARRYL